MDGTKKERKKPEPKQHKKPEEERTYNDYFTSLHTTESSIKDEYTALGILWSGSCPFLGTCPYIYKETKIQTCEQCVREYYSKQADC